MPSIPPAISRAIGPTLSRLVARGHTPSTGMRPHVVLRPVVPQHADGTRIEPPVSEPNATSASPSATATADPLEDPPGTKVGSKGFVGLPNHWLRPVVPNASSWRLALPTIRAPAARAPARHAASANAGVASSATALQPAVVGTPSTSMRSLTARWTPSPDVSNRVMNVLIDRRQDSVAAAASITRPVAQSSSSEPTGPTSCRLAGNGPHG